MMIAFSAKVAALFTILIGVEGYNANHKQDTFSFSRRNMLTTAALTAATSLLLVPRQALAAEDDVLTPLYFGVGVGITSHE